MPVVVLRPGQPKARMFPFNKSGNVPFETETLYW